MTSSKRPSFERCGIRSAGAALLPTTLLLLLLSSTLPTGASGAGSDAGNPPTHQRRLREPSARTAVPRAAPAGAQKTALVIGNAGYRVGRLTNPANDARAMARTLRGLGFQVEEHVDLSRKEIDRAVTNFAKGVGSKGVALVYYSGHGAQYGGRNYFIPVDAAIRGHDDLEIEGYPVDRILDKLGSSDERLNLIILDACRDNPFASNTRSTSQGLAQMSAPNGTMIAYATSPGKTASDNPGGANGLYTQELLRVITTPGLEVEDVFKRTRVAVKRRSGGYQVPWEESSIEGDFVLAGGPPSASAPPPEPLPLPEPVAPPRAAGDARVRGALDSLSYKYTVNDRGNFQLTFGFKDGRSQSVFVYSGVEKFGGREIREVTSTAYRVKGALPLDSSEALLLDNNRRKWGGWRVVEEDGYTYVIYAVQLPADADAATLRNAIDATIQTADGMEKEVTKADKF